MHKQIQKQNKRDVNNNKISIISVTHKKVKKKVSRKKKVYKIKKKSKACQKDEELTPEILINNLSV